MSLQELNHLRSPVWVQMENIAIVPFYILSSSRKPGSGYVEKPFLLPKQ
jgi:hypothetical protein